jgi:hypothetical protein
LLAALHDLRRASDASGTAPCICRPTASCGTARRCESRPAVRWR